MNTKTLVAGQDVYMFSDHYPKWFCNQTGKMVKVTPTGVEVEVADPRPFCTEFGPWELVDKHSTAGD